MNWLGFYPGLKEQCSPKNIMFPSRSLCSKWPHKQVINTLFFYHEKGFHYKKVWCLDKMFSYVCQKYEGKLLSSGLDSLCCTPFGWHQFYWVDVFAKPIRLIEEGACKGQAWHRIEDEVNNKRKERVEYGGNF